VANDHVTTIRLPIELADALELVARAEGKPVSEVIREAIAAHVEKRRADPEFQRRLRERIEADRRILERLADRPDDASQEDS
jgi:predicted DNA-binding protein